MGWADVSSSRLGEDLDVDFWNSTVVEPLSEDSLDMEGDGVSASEMEAIGEGFSRETLNISDALVLDDAGRMFSAGECGECLMCSALSISMGRSATPIIMLPTVPMIAEVAPVMGSQGPSSVSYSRGRYLVLRQRYFSNDGAGSPTT